MTAWPNHIGKSYPGGYTVEDEIHVPQGETKRIYLQKTRFSQDNRIEYRFTYYVLARKGLRQGEPVFSRNSVFVPVEQLAELLKQARKRSWPGFQPL
jgi:hypothetical protein